MLLKNVPIHMKHVKKKHIEKSSSTLSMFDAHGINLYLRQFIWFVDGWQHGNIVHTKMVLTFQRCYE